MSREETTTSASLTRKDILAAAELLNSKGQEAPYPIYLTDAQVDSWISRGFSFKGLNLAVSPLAEKKIREHDS